MTDFLDAVSSEVTSLIGDVSYLPFGPANVVTFGNGRTLSKTYDKDYAIDAVTSSDAAGLTIDASVDVLGNLINASSTLGATPPTRSYQYDPLYRLNGVTNSSAASLEAYSYDQTGDRLSKTFNGTAQSYAYPSPLTSHRLQSVAGTARSYDANGNTSAIGSTTFTYDDRNRLTSAGGVNYGYNGRGERVMKSSSTITSANLRFAYSSNGQLLAEYQFGYVCKPRQHAPGCNMVQTWLPKTEYLWLDGTLVGMAVNGTPFLGPRNDPTPAQLYYVETDQLGTPREVIQPGATTASDTLVWKWDFFGSAFGENAPSPQTLVFNLRYPGQYFDAESGLNYNYFRDYEPGTGRYVESDPIGQKGGAATYSYAGSNALSYDDPLGLFCTGTRIPISPWLEFGPAKLLFHKEWELDADLEDPEECEGGKTILCLAIAFTKRLKCHWTQVSWYEQGTRKKFLNLQVCIGDGCDNRITYKSSVNYEYGHYDFSTIEQFNSGRLVSLSTLDAKGACREGMLPPSP